jgi:hypothetical protein
MYHSSIQLVNTVIAILIPRICDSQIFFFWNRLLGIVVGFAIRLFMWKSSKVHVSIGKPSPTGTITDPQDEC